jgi:alpha-L-fucosidase
VGYKFVPWDTIRNLVKGIQPKCLMIENNHKYTMTNTEIIEYEMPIDGPPKGNNTLPCEGAQVIRAATDHCWFWHPVDECTLMPSTKIVSELNANNAAHANYLLDLTPDTLGLIPQCQVDVMKAVGVALGVVQ